MEILPEEDVDVEQFTPGQCVAYLKATYPMYFRCLNQKVKYLTEPITDDEAYQLGAVPLAKIKERALRALATEENALSNNLRIISHYSVSHGAKETFDIEDCDEKEYNDQRAAYINDWATELEKTEVLQPTAQQFVYQVKQPEVKLSIKTQNTFGFVCCTTAQAKQLTKENVVACSAVNPNAVTFACRLTDLCTYQDKKWKPKLYTNDFFKLKDLYTEVSTELAHYLNCKFVFKTSYIKGVELTGLIAQSCTDFFKKPGAAAVVQKVTDITNRVHAPNDHTKVCFKDSFGDYEAGTLDYAVALNGHCQTVRGGDNRDNSVADYSYYCGFAMPRKYAKAFVFCYDLQRLFDHVRMPLKLFGKDINKKLEFLTQANTFFGIISVDSQPKDSVPLHDGSRVYRKQGLSFLYTTMPAYVAVMYEGMTQLVENCAHQYAVQYLTAPATHLSNILPCTAVHTMGAFISVGQMPIHLNDYSDAQRIKAWCRLSIEVNRARTFMRHYNLFYRLAQVTGFNFLVPNFKHVSFATKTIVDRYADFANDDEYIGSVLSAVMRPEDYANYVEQVTNNRVRELEAEQDVEEQEQEANEDAEAIPALEGDEPLELEDFTAAKQDKPKSKTAVPGRKGKSKPDNPFLANAVFF